MNEESEITGLITYVVNSEECEIISLDSLEEKKGIGTALMKEVEMVAVENHCKRITLITTNDNLLALKFYQTSKPIGRGRARLVAAQGEISSPYV
jgi:GNAT superfamily N-acetyltransferase